MIICIISRLAFFKIPNFEAARSGALGTPSVEVTGIKPALSSGGGDSESSVLSLELDLLEAAVGSIAACT